MNGWRQIFWLVCAIALAMTPLAVRAQETAIEAPTIQGVEEFPSDERAIELGRDALGDRNRLPWYDAERDDIRAIDVPVSDQGQFSNRESRWNADPATPAKGSGTSWQGFGTFGDVLSALLKIAFWVLVIGILALLVYLLVIAYLNRENAAVASTARTTITNDVTDEQERISSLPFFMAKPRGDMLDEAMAQYQAGNYRQAVIFLYSYLLIQLDRHQQIHLARGKTNRMYLRELRHRPQLQSILERTMLAFEDVFFGNRPLSREGFEACWNQLDEFHKHVEQPSA
jgi:hypothetical protein